MNVRPELRPLKSRTTQSALALLFGLLLAAVGGLLIIQPASAAGNKPSGANGSVKIKNVPLDTGTPRNEPHVDCLFTVQWYGFDEGTNSTTVTFWGWPPSGDKSVVTPTKGQSEFEFEGGKPPGNTLNHSEDYQLDTTGLKANKKGEVHIKMRVLVTDSGGKVDFKKHKVFWVKLCGGPTPTPTPSPTVSPTETPSPSPTPTVGPTETPSPSPTTGGTATPSPGPTGFKGGLDQGGSGPTSGTGSDNPIGWIALFGGLGIAGAGLVRLLRPAVASHRSA
jgi:hypothetical protein